MKQFYLILAITFLFQFSFCQNFEKLSKYEFKYVESYRTEKDVVLKCANYLFENPSDYEPFNRLTAVQYIMKWMEGTPDYYFEIGEREMDLTKGNSDLFGLYLAAMSKAIIEHKGEKDLTADEIYTKAETILVNYCSDSNNNMKPTRAIKKIIRQHKSK
ncbi:hypothetical protein AB9K26_01715 [Psychroserpens sp. XS_ASV72]|uniref:hypothetical protein n=1 Tax=Psychroserpens sp. XS_ASV72 TaxID=3241293 RepID=UPI0035182293